MNDAQKKTLLKALESSEVMAFLKREFDRAFTLSVDEKDGRVIFMVAEKDTGSNVMTVGDVAAFLQTDRASVRRMTRERAQRASRYPIPFVKLGGKMLRFNRADIMEWWNKHRENTVLALPAKGKIRKK